MPATKFKTNANPNARILTEDVLSLNEARDAIPTRPSISTVWRWAINGRKGVKLETYQIGGKRLTSVQAIHRFFEAIQ